MVAVAVVVQQLRQTRAMRPLAVLAIAKAVTAQVLLLHLLRAACLACMAAWAAVAAARRRSSRGSLCRSGLALLRFPSPLPVQVGMAATHRSRRHRALLAQRLVPASHAGAAQGAVKVLLPAAAVTGRLSLLGPHAQAVVQPRLVLGSPQRRRRRPPRLRVRARPRPLAQVLLLVRVRVHGRAATVLVHA